jgi:hypothetical protein
MQGFAHVDCAAEVSIQNRQGSGFRSAAPVSHQKQPHQNATNAIEIEQKRSKINEADRYSAAHNGLVAGSSAVRTNNEINSCSEPCLRSRWALAPSIGEVPSSSERAACIAPNAEKLDNQKPWAAFFPFCSPWHPIVR